MACVCVCSGGGGNFVLSTSLVGYTTVLGAVAPMVHPGYGFFYRIRDDRWAEKKKSISIKHHKKNLFYF